MGGGWGDRGRAVAARKGRFRFFGDAAGGAHRARVGLAVTVARVAGKADVVEFRGGGRAGTARPVPVEYKRGKPKTHRADEVQLCAQAICLEEMFGVAVSEGALFYGVTRRRQAVIFDDELREITARVAQETRAMLAAAVTPLPILTKGCRRCSLESLCQPKRLQKPPSVARWLAAQLRE